jgi:hypothetical protein
MLHRDQLLQRTLAADSLRNASAEPTPLSALMDPTLLQAKKYTRAIFTGPDDLLQELNLLEMEQRASAHLAESRRLPCLNLNIGKIRVEMIILLLLETTK